MSTPITAKSDPLWFAVDLTVPDALSTTDLLDVLAALVANCEDPARLVEDLTDLHEANDQAEYEAGHSESEYWQNRAAQLRDQIRAGLDPVDIRARLNETPARALSAQLLQAARDTLSARIRAGAKPGRAA